MNEWGWMPHGACIAWDPAVIWMRAGSDAVIAMVYIAIPLMLISIAKRHKFLLKPLAWMFAAFILGCGGTHAMDFVTIWQPVYWADAFVRLATAVASVAAAVGLWEMRPAIDRLLEAAGRGK